MVREERLELSHLAAPEPKSGVSTNSTTPALHQFYIQITMLIILNPEKIKRLHILNQMVAMAGFEPATPAL